MNHARFNILFIFISLIIFILLIPVFAENNSIRLQYPNQENISKLKNLTDQSVEKRLNLLDSRVNDLAQNTKKPEKDSWDKLGTLSVLISGVFIGLISMFATNGIQKNQHKVNKVQTIQSFMTHLPSSDYRVVAACLRSVESMDREMALNLAEIFHSNGGFYTLICWSKGADMELAKRANQIIGSRRQTHLIQAKELYKNGMPLKDVVETMTKLYEKQPGVKKEQVKDFEIGIEYFLRSQKKE